MLPLPLFALLATAILLILVNPIGYRGGGADDWQYLQAARCAAAAHHPCLPDSHWATRLPLVLPLAAAIGMLGESRLTLCLVAALFGLLSLALFWWTVQRQFGRTAATIGGFALLGTPVYAMGLVGIGIEAVEFGAVLGALFCLQSADRGHGRGWAVGAGALLAVAAVSRPTSLVLVPFLAILGLFFPALRRHAVPFAAGLLAVLGLDAAAYAWAIGDPLHDWHLALGHAHLPSSEMAVPLADGESPLLNRRLIAGWRRPAGLDVHWTLDGLLNLLLEQSINLTLLAALALLAVERRRAGKAAWLLAAFAAFYFGALTFGLAVDPQPRMFLPVVAAAATIIGLLLARLWSRRARWPIAALMGLSLAVTGATIRDSYELQPAEPVIAAWAAEAPGRTGTDPTTRTAMTLVPAFRDLPLAAVGHNRRISISFSGCSDGPPGWHLLRRRTVSRADPALVAALRQRHFLFSRRQPASVCLFTKPVPDATAGKQPAAAPARRILARSRFPDDNRHC